MKEERFREFIDGQLIGGYGIASVRWVFFDYGDTLTLDDGHTVDPLAATTIRNLHCRGYRIGLASNVGPDDPPRHESLREAGVLEYFTAIVTSDAVGCLKPHTCFYRAVLAAAGCPPEHVVWVGNRLASDVLGPLAHGVRAVLIHPIDGDHGAPARVPVVEHVSWVSSLLDWRPTVTRRP